VNGNIKKICIIPEEVELKPRERVKSCMSCWLPKIKKIPDIVYPATTLIEFENQWDIINEDGGPKPQLIAGVKSAANEMGYPCFIKTGLVSGKHSWRRTCFLANDDHIYSQLYNLVQESMMADQGWDVWAVRKYIEMDSAFTAFDGLPISKEARFFVEDGRVRCFHPYWPPEAFGKETYFGDPLPDNFEALLYRNNHLSYEDITALQRLARKVSKAIPGYWSVDFCKGKDGIWYLIDMAEGDRSWHWSPCPANSTPLEKYDKGEDRT